MNTPNPSHSTLRRHRAAQSGFTLVEVLAAIAVIAILAAILVPSIFSALNRARETAIVVEVQNLNLAMEDFKNHYGFYPPTIGDGTTYAINRNGAAAQMLPYLNKISRNHAEGDGSAGTRLAIWWANVGSKMDERTSLVFWLNGLCKNKQFPLSGASGVTDALAPYAVDQYWDGTPVPPAIGEIARDVRYDFNKGQLETFVDNIVFYNQPFGTGNDKAYRFHDNKSYGAGAYVDGSGNLINPDSFQLVSPGMDGLVGAGLPQTNLQHDDNIVNFPPGRFDAYVNNNQ